MGNRNKALFGLILLCGCLVGSAARAQETLPSYSDTDFETRCRLLFNGETLSGWEGDAYWFHTRGDVIVAGRLEKPIPNNQFLCTTEVFADFDLRMSVRLLGDGRNAGVQLRSSRVGVLNGEPSTEVSGYQADLGEAWGRGVWGALYDESRRNRMLAEPDPPVQVAWLTPPADLTRNDAVPQTPWMELRILCVGSRVQVFVDGRMTVDFTEIDPSIARQGVVGLQIHSGPPSEAWYRNPRILPL